MLPGGAPTLRHAQERTMKGILCGEGFMEKVAFTSGPWSSDLAVRQSHQGALRRMYPGHNPNQLGQHLTPLESP